MRHGLEPTLVEKAESLRTAGYVIDFWGAGFEVAERMDLLPAVRKQGYRVREVRMVDRNGRRVGGFSTEVFFRSTADRFVSLPRGALASLIYGALDGQVETPGWTKGRVGLLGDAASCVSLLAGQGSALAMVSAYVLAGELKLARADPERAFARYQQRLGPLIARKQEAAKRFGGFFAPSSRVNLFLRNHLSRLLAVRLLARLTIGREMTDELRLPEY